jgi:hypothetical protein
MRQLSPSAPSGSFFFDAVYSSPSESSKRRATIRRDGSATIFISHAAKQHEQGSNGNGRQRRISLQHGKDSRPRPVPSSSITVYDYDSATTSGPNGHAASRLSITLEPVLVLAHAKRPWHCAIAIAQRAMI